MNAVPVETDRSPITGRWRAIGWIAAIAIAFVGSIVGVFVGLVALVGARVVLILLLVLAAALGGLFVARLRGTPGAHRA
jgi:hypothetical protein